MERRLARINSSTAGGTAGAGAKTHKVTLPSRWLQVMGITDEKRAAELAFDGHQIMITRVVTIEEFYDEKKAQSHSLKTLKFWNADTLCTTIVVDFTDHTLCAENHTGQMVKTAFGKKTASHLGRSDGLSGRAVHPQATRWYSRISGRLRIGRV